MGWRSTFAALLLAATAAPAAPADPPGATVFRECLALPAVGRGGRVPLPVDPVAARLAAEGDWTPRAGETVTRPDGTIRTWMPLAASAEGTFSGAALARGYAFMAITAPAPRVMLLSASGHAMVAVHGEPRAGDPYETGWVRLPVRLRAGENRFFFKVARGRLRARLDPPKATALLDTRDATLPDVLIGENGPLRGAVVVANATTGPLAGLRVRAAGPVGPALETALPPVPPLGVRKVGVRLPVIAPRAPGAIGVRLALLGTSVIPLDQATLSLRVRRPTEPHRRTFVSAIDGSVQYYAVHPVQLPAGISAEVAPALFLSLHGAGVEAIGQAQAYGPKTWGHLVAPTNRRPYGFDWEDWGRLDALEVLEIARKRLGADPRRIYLTGHSMGGHGTWHLGVTYPDRFAAIGPSAGWISFRTYGGGQREAAATGADSPSPVEAMLQRGTGPGDTLALAENLRDTGVYVLHGDADDNVPVTQARRMRERLAEFHHDWLYHEQPGASHWWDASDEPGADCVDWAPLFDFFARHPLPLPGSIREVTFATADPGVSARCHWLGIEAQVRPLVQSRASVRCDPSQHRFAGTTENVARMSLRLDPLLPGGPVKIELDGQTLASVPAPTGTRQLWLAREGSAWRVTVPPSPSLKRPEQCGPFKQAFCRRMQFVYGTRGTPEENAWALAKARFDAELFWVRGNGSVDVLPDSAFDPGRDRERGVILYGNADTNAAWRVLLGDSPVTLRRGHARVGGRELTGADLAALFVRPRPGSRDALVAAVGGTGLHGMRLTDRLPYFTSGVAYPDLILLGPDSLTKGSEGVKIAGYFGNDWRVETGEWVGDVAR